MKEVIDSSRVTGSTIVFNALLVAAARAWALTCVAQIYSCLTTATLALRTQLLVASEPQSPQVITPPLSFTVAADGKFYRAHCSPSFSSIKRSAPRGRFLTVGIYWPPWSLSFTTLRGWRCDIMCAIVAMARRLRASSTGGVPTLYNRDCEANYH